MSALCTRLSFIRPVLQVNGGLLEWTQTDKIKWTTLICRLCTKASDATGFAVRPQQKLSKFQKRLLYISGKYPSMEECPDFAGEAELRNATDICKTLFNIWCIFFLTFGYAFVHWVEKRRMSRAYARANRSQARMMKKFDRINKEMEEQRKLQKL